MRYFVKAVHVQLADKGWEFVVFEPFAEVLFRQAFMVKYWIRRASIYRLSYPWAEYNAPKNESPVSDQHITSFVDGSSTIL